MLAAISHQGRLPGLKQSEGSSANAEVVDSPHTSRTAVINILRARNIATSLELTCAACAAADMPGARKTFIVVFTVRAAQFHRKWVNLKMALATHLGRNVPG